MQDLIVALVQADQIWEDKSANRSHYETLLSNLDPSVNLIVLPEMFDTCFSMNTDLAEEWSDSSSLTFLKKLARDKNAAVYTSFMCRENGHFFNRGTFVYPDGRIVHYDKRKTFGLAGEDKVFTAGNTEKIVDFQGWKIQLQICYDLRFPEISRNALVNGSTPAYDVLIYVANWPERRSLHWKSLLQARAIENQSYVIGVNRVGLDGKNLLYSGDSASISALGEIDANDTGESVNMVTLSASALSEVRTSLPFLRDR